MLTPPYALPEERSTNAADFLARWQATLLANQRKSGLHGAEGVRSDLELAWHQARTVLEVLSAPRVRHVFADEVGMGKTIEALQVYQALRLERPGLRTMVLVPGHLAFQWLGEVYLRAHRVFAIASGGRPTAPGALSGAEILEQAQEILLDREWISGDAAARERLEKAWLGRRDRNKPRLLIVDEAHRLSPEAYKLVQDLGRKFDHVLLLTATPVELEAGGRRDSDQLRYEELLRLLDPDFKEKEFEELRAREARVTAHFQQRAPGKKWIEGFRTLLADDPVAPALVDRALAGGEDELEDLLDHVAAAGLAAWRVLRHRRADAPKVFRKRIAHRHVLAAPGGNGASGYSAALKRAEDAIGDAFPKKDRGPLVDRFRWRASIAPDQAALAAMELENALGSTRGDDTARARRALIQVKDELIRFAQESDPKIERLVDLISTAWAEDRKAGRRSLRKFLIFVTHRSTLDRVARMLEEELATDVAVFHEGLDNSLRDDGEPPERLQQLLDFRNKPTSSILVCVDLAAEGHNLHSTCHTVVLYDLPMNPNTTEQRIGRVDRLGQSKDVTVHLLLLEGTAAVEQAERQAHLGVFESSIGALAPSEEEALAQGKTLEKGSRRDLTSPLRAYRNRPSDELEERIRATLDAPPGWVFRASTKFQDWYGDAELAQACLGSALTRAISRAFDLKAQRNENPPPRVRESLRFRLARGSEAIPGYRDTWGTCDRDEALDQDHLQFFAWGHPFVEDVLGRALQAGHGQRQALRYRLKGTPAQRGVLMHFTWDPALGLDEEERARGERLARTAFPTLSIPVVVSMQGGKATVEAGPPPREGPSLLRVLLAGLVELDPHVCEAILVDAYPVEENPTLIEKGQAAALELARKSLAGLPSRLGRRALARAAMEVARDRTLDDPDSWRAVVQQAVPALAGERLERALVLDQLATFEVVEIRG